MPIATPPVGDQAWDDEGAAMIARINALTDDTTQLVPAAALGTGTRDGTRYLRDDGVWAVPPGSGGGTVPRRVVTGDTTLVAADRGGVVEVDSAGPATVSVPTVAASGMVADSATEVCQVGAGQVTIASSSGGTTYSEPFTSALALTWSTMSGGAISVSGGTQGVLSGGAAQVRAESDVGSPDMFAQLTWTAGGASTDSTMGVCTRCSTSALTAYLYEVDDFTNFWTLTKVVAGTYTQIGSGAYSPPARPLVLRLESQGTTHRCYAGGTLLGTVTDATITTGQRGGIVSYNPTAAGIVFDDFSTGALVSGVTLTPTAYRKTRIQGSTIGLRLRGTTNQWIVSGDVE